MNKFLNTFCLLLLTAGYFSQNMLNNPVKWQSSYKDLENSEGEITIIATVDPGWHLYSQRINNVGPIPTSFTFSPSKNVQIIGKTEEEGAKEEYEKAFDAKVYVFTEKAVFKQKIKRNNLNEFSASLSVEYMCCNNVMCLPPKTIQLNVKGPAISLKK